MAQQIVIDIVAETKKLTQGFNDAQGEINNLNTKLKGVASAAGAAASAFILKKGVTFLQQGIDEAKDAALAMKQAETAFGKGSKALEEITKDAEKFGKQLSIDNDDILKLATQLGSRLPKEVQASSAELVKIFKDVEAFTGGAVSAESAAGKLAKAFADGEIKAKELQKIFPGLKQSVYDQAEALSKAGKNQDALNLLIEAGSKKYDDAAAKNTTATQKFETALANFKETLGAQVLPIIEKALGVLTDILEAFDKQPDWVKNFELGLLALVGIGGPLLSFVSNTKLALVNLGLMPAASGAAATGLNLVKVALAGLGIGLVIAAIVLLIQHWDDVSAAAKKTYEAVTKWLGDMFEKVKDWLTDAKKWFEDNWPKLLAVLTGPFGLFVAFLVTHKTELIDKFKDIWENVKTAIGDKLTSIKTSIEEKWDAIKGWIVNFFLDPAKGLIANIKAGWELIKMGIDEKINSIKDSIAEKWDLIKESLSAVIEIIKLNIVTKFIEMFTTVLEWVTKIKLGVIDKFTELKDKAVEQFNKLKDAASKIWDNIKGFISDVATNIKEKLDTVFTDMIEVGKDIARGIWQGLTSMTGWFKMLLKGWVESNIPSYIRNLLNIKSPSKVMMKIGEQITEGLYIGMGLPGKPGITLPTINVGGNGAGAGAINVTINAGVGTDPYALGRTVQQALTKYGKITV